METGTKIGRLTKSSFFENLADEDRSLKNNLVTLTWSSLLLLVTNRMNNVFFLVAEVRDFFLREVKKEISLRVTEKRGSGRTERSTRTEASARATDETRLRGFGRAPKNPKIR